MRSLVTVLGMPQNRFASIHVVGSNGKSSTARTAAALLEAQGVASGAYLSPHVERWNERILIHGDEISDEALATAVGRVAEAVETVDRTLEEGDSVTQFEVVTAAAFVAFAAAGVEVAVIEAGLGGRLDATNVIPSSVVALPSISLEHTDLLGTTEEQIAAEKLAVLRDHSALVIGPVSAEVEVLAAAAAARRTARLEHAGDNVAVAVAAVRCLSHDLDEDLVNEVVGGLRVPGVLERVDGDPPMLLDVAHNPGGARWLAAALKSRGARRSVVACVALLEDKDVVGFAEALAPALMAVVCTELPPERLRGVGRPGARSASASRLVETFTRAGVVKVEAQSQPEAAIERARALALDAGGVALVSGTHYLLPYAWTERHGQNSSR